MRAAILSALFVTALAGTAGAQVCIRARPKPACSSFLLTEVSLSHRIAAGTYGDLQFGRVRPSRGQEVWEFGIMGNAGKHWAVGGGGFLALSAEGDMTGWRLRVRRWVGRGMSVDVAPGIILGSSENYPPAFNGQVALNLNTWLSVTSTLQVMRMVSQERQPNFPFALILTKEPVTSWFVGARMGALPGVVAGSALALLTAFLRAALAD